MQKYLRRKILCSILAASICGSTSFVLAANSGGEMTKADIYGEQDAYVGNNGTSSNNEVYFDDNGGNKYIYVVGGYAASGEASSNSVTVSGANVKSVRGGYVADSSGAANNNSVVVSGGSTVIGIVYGGYADGSSGAADNNRVVIIDSTVSNAVVYGGSSFKGTANNNSVTIAGSSDLTTAFLYGRGDDTTGTGNKLVLIDFKGKDGTDTSVKSLNNFDSIEVKALGDDKEYTAGDKLTLLTATGDSGKYINNCEVGESTQYALFGTDRVAVEVKGNAAIEGEKVTFTVEGMQASRQSAITTEARAGVTAFVNQGAEVVADNLNMLSQSQEGINTFATVSGNNSKYDTGSYADINGWNSIVGIASTKEIGSDKLNYGAFFENGSGNYNTYNEIGGAGFRGDGNVLYNGGGVMVRLDKENGFYTEAAVRAGSVKNELNRGLADAWGNNYGYETENAYYGGHIGIGKIFKLENGKAWDVYGKYFHMHHEGDSVEIAGEIFEFDSVDSNKLRIGARFSEQQGEKLTSYYGLAWDYEFSGDVSGTAAGYDMHTPSLDGSTVIGEIGFRYTPGKESPWYFDANVKGYVGIQEGLSGNVQAVYSF